MLKQARVLFHFGDALFLRALTLAPDHLPFRLRTRTAPRPEVKEETVEASHTVAMLASTDAGTVNGHRFFKKAWLAPSSSATKKPFHVELVCDGRSRYLQSTGIAIGIGHYADEKPIAEADDVDRSKLFLSSHTPSGRLERFKPRRCGAVEVTQAHSIQIITDEPMTIYADGKPVTRTPATFTFFGNP